uniref:Uncharacterized protein n=1 Tax=Romanomermis culicivorax TaxID=13658 RepID=A0A915KJD4_ROMCU
MFIIVSFSDQGFKSTAAVASRSVSKSSAARSKSATGRKSPRNRLDGKVTFKETPATSTIIINRLAKTSILLPKMLTINVVN